MLYFSFFLFTSFLVVHYVVFGDEDSFPGEWNYDLTSRQGPRFWKHYNSLCGGTKQSPINIATADTIRNPILKPLTLENYKTTNMEGIKFRLKNKEASMLVSFTSNKKSEEGSISLTHMDLTYRLAQFHLHVAGNTSTNGSEHTVDGKRYPGEIHFVHYNTKYATIDEALNHVDGLLVWGHFIDVSTSENRQWKILTDALQLINKSANKVYLRNVTLYDLLSKSSERAYYTYFGSLTTPTCNEVVTWVISQQAIKISEEQLNEFRFGRQFTGNHDEENLNNFRPLQDLHGRKVYRFDDHEDLTAKSAFSLHFFTISIVAGGITVAGGMIIIPSFIWPKSISVTLF